MKIIIPIIFSRQGGVERVIISLVISLVKYVDRVILVLPNSQMEHFKSLLPESEKICYESFKGQTSSIETKYIAFLNKIIVPLWKFRGKKERKKLEFKIQQLKTKNRLNELISKYDAEYCLYTIINRISPPDIKAHLTGLSHDLFWMFAPLTYSENYQSKYNKPLELWLKKADILFTNSQKTHDDILKVFFNSEYQKKLKAIPLSGFSVQDKFFTEQAVSSLTGTLHFYFPSSFGIYKDHLTLLKAGIILAQKGLKFKIILVGRETDGLIQGKLKLSQQSQAQEYVAYLEKCQALYTQHQSIFEQYFEGLGYCDYDKVEYLYQNSSCVVMPSKYEGFGLAVSEAIVRGLPVIASDLEVFREQVELYKCHDRVQFFPQENAEALAERMAEFIKQPQPKLTPAEIQKRFAHWTWDEVALEYIKALQSIPKKTQ